MFKRNTLKSLLVDPKCLGSFCGLSMYIFYFNLSGCDSVLLLPFVVQVSLPQTVERRDACYVLVLFL
jgi:hypothetical protein